MGRPLRKQIDLINQNKMRVAIFIFLATIFMGAAKAVDWEASIDPIKCYIGAVGAEIEETCDSGTCEKTGSEIAGVDMSVKTCAFEYHAEEGCNTTEVAGVTIKDCFCNTDLCNSATSMAANLGIFVILSVFYCVK